MLPTGRVLSTDTQAGQAHSTIEFQLISHDANTESHTFVLDGQPVTVGRSSDNDVRVARPEVRRRHCQVERIENVVVVHDLGSSNGTFVNGFRITEAILRPDDKLTMGKTAFTVACTAGSTGQA